MAKRNKDERTNNIPQDDTHKNLKTRTPLNTGGQLERPGGVSSV